MVMMLCLFRDPLSACSIGAQLKPRANVIPRGVGR